MRPFTLLAVFCVLSYAATAQTPQWLNYANDYQISQIAFENSFVWVSTQGGLVRLDPETGAKQTFQPWNSGLRGLSVGEILVNPDGSKWIGSQDGGLLHWDGADAWQQFYYINTGDTLIDVRNLRQDNAGNLWFISNVNGNCSGCSKLFRYDGSAFHKIAVSPDLGNYKNLALDNFGAAWASSGYKLVRFENDQVQTIFDAGNSPLLNKESVTQIGFDNQNNLYCTTSSYNAGQYSYRLLRFDGSAWTILGPSVTGQNIAGGDRIFADSVGNLWIASIDYLNAETLLFKYDGASWTVYSENDLNLNTLPGTKPIHLNIDPQGHLWGAIYQTNSQHIVHEYDWNTWKSHNTEIFPLATNYGSDVAFDNQQNTWFAGHQLLTRFDGVSWHSYTQQDFGVNASYFDIWSLAVDQTNGNLWLSFYDNNDDPVGFAKFDGTHFTTFQTPEAYDVFEILPRPDGAVWVAAALDGLGYFNGTTWTWYDENNSPLSSGLISDIDVDLSGNIWMCAYGKGVGRFNGNSWAFFNPQNSPVPTEYPAFVYVDQSNRVWTQGANGLLYFNGSSWQEIAMPGAGTPYFNISRIVEDTDHTFWIATSNHGAWHWDGGSGWTQYTVANSAIAENYIRQVRIDPYGNKWFVHNNGFSVFNPNGISNQFVNPNAAVRGQVFYDAGQNGQKDPGVDPGMPGEKVLLLPDNLITFTANDGLYSFFPAPGQYSVQHLPQAGYTLTTSPSAYPLQVGTANQSGFDFGAWTADPPDSMRLELAMGLTRCSMETPAWLYLTNLGLENAAGAITLTFDPALTYLSADPAPLTISGNTITWKYQDLPYLGTLAIRISFKAPDASATGNTLELLATASREENGQQVQSYRRRVQSEVRCSFDPNDKLVRPAGPSQGVYSLLGDALEYTVRFQNTGNDTAFAVVIRDTLDAQLDPSTFEVLASSHPVRVQLTPGGVVTFVFEKINLLWQTVADVASQGFVQYRVRPRAGLPDGARVENTAHIYFDFNPGIVTNTTANVLVETLPAVGTASPAPLAAWRLYPNPAHSDVWVDWPGKAAFELNLFDAAGKLVKNTISGDRRVLLTGLEPGFYFVCPEGGGCKKLVVLR